jgi:uncharacterized membrane protein
MKWPGHVQLLRFEAYEQLTPPRLPAGGRRRAATGMGYRPGMTGRPPMQAQHRFERLDALRGAAVVWMVVFHACFDLNHFGLWSPPQHFLADPFWTSQRTAIVSLFLWCAGLGQAVALDAGQRAGRFWRRWAQVAGCALLVSAGSAWMFPRSWISFGVLHGVAVMLLLLRWGAGRLWRPGAGPTPGGLAALWGLGAAALWAPSVLAHPMFNGPAWRWTGLVTRLPVTEDYVPVLPWLGVMLWGLAAGAWLLRRRPAWLAGAVPGPLRALAALGRWSLSVYMLHQPLLIGLISAWVAWQAA